MSKQYSNVKAMIQDISEDKSFNASLEREIDSRQITRFLIAMRNRMNLSVKDIAIKTKTSSRKIARIENSYDRELNVSDILMYANGLNMRTEISFLKRDAKIVDRVKHYYFKLKRLMDSIVDMSKGDKAMEQEAAKFTREALFNISNGLIECLQKVEQKKKVDESLLVVSSQVSYVEQEEDQVLETQK